MIKVEINAGADVYPYKVTLNDKLLWTLYDIKEKNYSPHDKDTIKQIENTEVELQDEFNKYTSFKIRTTEALSFFIETIVSSLNDSLEDYETDYYDDIE